MQALQKKSLLLEHVKSWRFQSRLPWASLISIRAKSLEWIAPGTVILGCPASLFWCVRVFLKDNANSIKGPFNSTENLLSLLTSLSTCNCSSSS